MLEHRVSVGLVCAALLSVGCGETKDRDSGPMITFDAAADVLAPPPPDTGPRDMDGGGTAIDAGADAGTTMPPMGAAGAPCTSDADCTDGACITEADGFTGGYCVVPGCNVDDPTTCAAGSSCLQVNMAETACFATCEPGTAGTCRRGYACASGLGIPDPICLPGCSDDSDCPAGRRCDPMAGDFGAGGCYDPAAAAGVPCVDDTGCSMGAICLAEAFNGYPGGSCATECDATGAGCGMGETCIGLPGFHGIAYLCLQACTTPGTTTGCRDAYRCATNPTTSHDYCAPGCTSAADCSEGRSCNPATGLCADPFDPDQLGGACRGGMGCVGGTCLRESTTGFPGSYCAYLGCDATMPDAMDGCPGNGVCMARDSGTNVCLLGCGTDASCRTGYACRPLDAAHPERGNACVPNCTSSMQCVGMANTCHPDGYCRPMFDPAQQGEPCDGSSGCVGGTCLTEATAGYPSGLCVAANCPLDGTAMGDACPAGSACVDDGMGSATLGICLDTCDPSGTATCRPGYACQASGMVSVCQPHCTGDADCDSTRRCDAVTGKCVAR